MTQWKTFLWDSVENAARSLWAKKLRSVLSILGIVIGIFTVSSLLTIAYSVRDGIEDAIGGLGANLLFVVPGKIDQGGASGFAAQLGASTLTEKDFSSIRSQVPEAQNLSMGMVIAGAVKSGAATVPNGLIFGASPGFERAVNLTLAQGRFTDQRDESLRTRVIVVGDAVAQDLFGGSGVLQRQIEIRGERFDVVGVLEKVSSAISLGGPDFNSIVLMPLETAWEITNTRQIFRIAMQAPSADDVVPMKEKIKEIILANHGGEEDFSVLSQDDLISLVGSILDLLTAMIGAITAISLVVGGIGIMNIMLVVVNERIKEIGIRKAVGATRGAILAQFLVESVLLTFAGGVVAVVAFIALVESIESHVPIPLSVNPWIMGTALVFSAVVGIIFGIVPAYQASRKDPIVALRSE